MLAEKAPKVRRIERASDGGVEREFTTESRGSPIGHHPQIKTLKKRGGLSRRGQLLLPKSTRMETTVRKYIVIRAKKKWKGKGSP